MNPGKLIVIAAPSGSGKTTLVHYLLRQPELRLEFSVSATSRPKRSNETEGKDYYFISATDFKTKIAGGEFLEYEEVYPNTFYGTLKREVARIWVSGKHVIFDVDVYGGLRLKRLFPTQILAIFVKPPSIEVLQERLRDRKTESDAQISMRIAKATQELTKASEYDAVLVNAHLETAQKEIYALVSRFING